MPAFDFPNPPTPDQEVTNDATGVTYRYDAATQSWVIVTSQGASNIANDVAQLQTDLNSLESLLPLETSARQQGDVNLQNQIDDINAQPDPVTDLSNYYTKPETYSQTQVDNLIDNIDTGGNVNLDNYYTKDEIDNQFSLRGVGYTYLVSSFNGTITIRPGELHTNNRLVGQITAISLGPEDDNGKQRRDAVAGDTIEIYDIVTTKYYRYLINSGGDGTYSVTYQGSVDEQNDPLSMGQPYIIYMYPTHISSANYYDKAASDERFMSLKPGAVQVCQRGINFQAAIDYTGQVQYSTNVANKRYVDEQVATRATVQYVNDEVDKMASALSVETAEPNVYYGDYAPTGTRQDGDMWFDSMNLRLNVWSQGAWINPDRNDGASLENRISALEARIAQLEGN